MSKMYSKPGSGNSKFLYDSTGKIIGRGITDSKGKTIYTGTDGRYLGKSYETAVGTVKYVDASNKYVGTGLKHPGASPIDCSAGEKTEPHGHNGSVNTSTPKAQGAGCMLVLCWAVIICSVLALLMALGN